MINQVKLACYTFNSVGLFSSIELIGKHRFEIKDNKENELEDIIISLHENKTEGGDFITALLNSQVFMPIFEKHKIEGLQESSRPKLLLFKDENDVNVMILFTNPERAKPVAEEHTGYEGGLLADFNWVLAIVEPGWGISINPGLESGIDLEPDMVQQIIDSQTEH